MSSPHLRLVVSNPAGGGGQMSRGNGLSKRVSPFAGLPELSPEAARAFWAGLLLRRCRSNEEVAVLFGVTFQTACNWLAQTSTPTGDKVLLAVRLWPEEFGLVAGREAA